MTIALRRSVELTDSEDGSILLDTARGVYWHLNDVGARFVRGIQEGKSLDQVTALIAKDYSVDQETVKRDVGQLVKDLKEARLIEVHRE